MLQKIKDKNYLIITAFIFSSLYWIYLAFICQMLIWDDAVGYEATGKLLIEDGWQEFFKTGPGREPLYPFLVSLSMQIGQWLSTSYKTIQIFFQILILFCTQYLLFMILKNLKINKWIMALTILYFGFSPALVFSAFRLYSEIAAYPFILLIILLGSLSWQRLHHPQKDYVGISFLAFGLGCAFILTTFVKGIYEIIAPLCLFPVMMFSIQSFFKKEKIACIHSLVFLFVFFLTFQGTVITYKLINKAYNNRFALTDRGPWALYGNTARRMEKMTSQRIASALAYVFRPEYCYKKFGDETCKFWHYSTSDGFGHAKNGELQHTNRSQDDIDKMLVMLSIQRAFSNPFQYVFLMIIESLKMFFWEFRSIAYVVYPSWLIKIFYFGPFNDGLSSLMALLTLLALVYSGQYVWKRRMEIFSSKADPDKRLITIGCIFFFTLAHIGFHSLFFILPRYAFPIVPLYLIMMAFSLDQILYHRR